MQTESVAIETLSLDPANVRKHGKRNLDAIISSLRRFGQQKPIVVDSRNVVRAGNGTLAAAQALGWKAIAIVRSDLPLAELAAYSIADNRTAELAEWDLTALELLAANGQLVDVGFADDELAKMLGNSDQSDDDAAAIEEKFEVVVECRDEMEQKSVFEKMTGEGFSCRLFTL